MVNKWKEPLYQLVNSGVLLLFAFLCAYPFYYIIVNSLSHPAESAKGVYFWPQGLTLSSYEQLMQIPTIFQSVFISVARTVVGTIITVFCSAFVGYMVTKKELPFRRGIYRLIIITMFFNSGLIPWYMLMKMLYLKNNFLLYVLPGAVSAFFIILVKTYIESLPVSLEESAQIDGAGVWTIFIKIIFPLSLPIIACIAVFTAVRQWNSWADNFYLVTDSKLNTLQYLLYTNLKSNMADIMRTSASGTTQGAELASSGRVTPMSIRYAITVVTVFPIMLLYPFMQKYFVKGIMLGAIKG